MNCLTKSISYVFDTLEKHGFYEPVIDIEGAKARLLWEKEEWEKHQTNRNHLWSDFQKNRNIQKEPTSALFNLALDLLENLPDNQKVAVDLGCGISATTYQLLKKGWTVYAVDQSPEVLQNLKRKIEGIEKKWIDNNQLLLINSSVEEFSYPERKIHLIIAMDSLPYLDPMKIEEVLLKAKDALADQGILACTLFPYSQNPLLDEIMRAQFGAWMTRKNIITALMQSINFQSWWRIFEGTTPSGLVQQFHILAQNTTNSHTGSFS